MEMIHMISHVMQGKHYISYTMTQQAYNCPILGKLSKTALAFLGHSD